jgi:flagellar assembly protein FliH
MSLSELITLPARPRAVRVKTSGHARPGHPEVDRVGPGVPVDQWTASASGETRQAPIPATMEERLQEEYQRGFEEGKAATEIALQKEYERRLEAERSELQGLFEEMRVQLNRLYARIEKEAHLFALAVAERVIKKEVSTDTTIILRQAAEALKMVVGVESIALRVNPIDAALLRDHRQELMTSADSLRECVIEGDDKIQPGGCIIDTPSGTIDARIATQLKQIEAMLFSGSDGQGGAA